jgi:deazaflavin-dependent oxidoreductase (nitroreductase family)
VHIVGVSSTGDTTALWTTGVGLGRPYARPPTPPGRDEEDRVMLPRAVRPVVSAFTRTRLFRRFGPRVVPPLERMLARLTGGRVVSSGLVVPSLVLRTKGARTGEPRAAAMIYCPEPGGAMLVAGSNYARGTHPAWTANLLAHPEAEVAIGRRRIPVRAALVGEDEREAVWARLEAGWPGYRGYERLSGRRIRLFRLTPR